MESKMNSTVRVILSYLVDKEYIGGKHTHEDKLIKRKSRWLPRKEQKAFAKEYKKIRSLYLIREKKRTGKSSDWYISINPRNLAEVKRILNAE